MARKKNKKREKEKEEYNHKEKKKWYEGLTEETKHSILAVIFFVLGLLFSFAYFKRAGIAGNIAYRVLEWLFGTGFFLVPTMFFIGTISLITSLRPNFLRHTIIGGILFLISSLGLADIIFGEKTGGYLGYLVSLPLIKLFDFWISLVILSALCIISFLIIFNRPIKLKLKKKEETKTEETKIFEPTVKTPAVETEKEEKGETPVKKEEKEKSPKDEEEKEFGFSFGFGKKKKAGERETKTIPTQFVPPPLELLEGDRGKPSSGDIKANANIIKRTLQNFGIEVEMDEINIGPSVTQYTFKPAEGIKLSRITALQNDLSLALAAYPLRIEAPIPGKSLVGIEIPNSNKTIIGLSSLFSEEQYQKSPHPLLIAMGRDVTGRAVFANIAKMPHLLVAGATGSGKSIFIHCIVMSLLYHNSPESLRFIMIDPKRVELTVYNKIPHLLTPVITEPKKAILALKWACKEMERRYDILLKAGARDILSYHEKHGSYNSMPYLIIIIDELADMMATYPREMEASIVRLAQMSRAVGIHLIVSTQRPSVEVITGLIKANITSRVALQVASQIDSRTILDMAGAEKLLGSGDMLYLAGDTSKPRRLQGPMISEKEIKQVVKYIADQYKNVDFDDLSEEKPDLSAKEMEKDIEEKKESQIKPLFDIDNIEDKEDDDELYEEAKNLVIKTGKASSSYLQRRFKIGYARAARLIDMLEERGVVGPGEGAKPREVLIKGSESDYIESEDINEDIETKDNDIDTSEEGNKE